MSNGKGKGYEQRPNQGSLFENDKQGNESRPDMTGSMLDEQGRKVWISGWWKKKQNGEAFLSLAFRLADGNPKTENPISERAKAREPGWAPAARKAPIDDDIPFARPVHPFDNDFV